MKINIETSPPDIWIRIRFPNGSGSHSLLLAPINLVQMGPKAKYYKGIVTA